MEVIEYPLNRSVLEEKERRKTSINLVSNLAHSWMFRFRENKMFELKIYYYSHLAMLWGNNIK